MKRYLGLVLSLSLVAACGQALVDFPAPVVLPTVTSTSPAASATGVATNSKVSATFSATMDPAFLTASSFTLSQGGTTVPGTVVVSATTATFSPSAALASNSTFVATVKAGVKDAAGNALASNFIWTFTTSALVDSTPPTVTSTVPADAATGVSVSQKVFVTFSEPMDATTITGSNFTLKQGANAVAGTVSYATANALATFTPTAALTQGLVYTGTVSTGVKDVAGNALAAPFTWSFTTVAPAPVPPTVSSTTPANLANSVATNVKPSATFSVAMDGTTLTPSKFTLSQGVNAVTGTVTTVGSKATFTPTTTLATNTTYAASVKAGVKDLAGNALLADFNWSFTTSAISDNTPPVVLGVDPLNASTGVPVNKVLAVTFNKPMDSSTIIAGNFTLVNGTSTVTGAVSYVAFNNVAKFTPAANLAPNTQYTATVTTGVKDVAGNAMAVNFVWSFTTGTPVALTVTSTNPLNNASGVPTSSSASATFSANMNPTTINGNTFKLSQGVNPVAGSVTTVNATATFKPKVALAPNTLYTANLKSGSSGVQDMNGGALASDFSWTFTTGNADVVAPTVTQTTPIALATNVPVTPIINATFSEPMDMQTMIAANFTLRETSSTSTISGTVSYDSQNMILTFNRLGDLKPDTDYTVTVTSGAKDLAGNALVVPATNGQPKPNPWTFRTATVAAPPPALAVNLGAAATFGLASRAGMTSTGITVVNGDIALSPTATCTDATGNAGASQTCLTKVYKSTTGMTVNGSIYYAGDPFDSGVTANRVSNDLNNAWVEGKNKIDTRGSIAGDEMAGKIFLPGVYHNATLGLAAAGLAVLDAQNDSNAVFFFKVDSSFVDSGTLLLPTEIRLVNGAQARNVWFIAGLDITIGSGTTWHGNILAGRSATVLDGSTLVGRVLAGATGSGAMTLTGAASPSVTTVSVPAN